jgi:nicotinate-nucleotide--dimethylbenzimidazole phosphoribosyltransferase
MLNLPEVDDLHDAALAVRLQLLLDGKTKPLGALGRIEALALQLGLVLGTEAPILRDPQLVVFAADHGLAAQGVSAYPSDVTWQMVKNFLAGGAAASVLARQHGLALTVVDCGVRHDFAPQAGLVQCKVAPGTADASQGPAMTKAQCEQAIAAGQEVARALPGNALLLGEMGIGNTSAAALLLARLARVPLAECVGSGTGLDAAGVARKQAVLERVLHLHRDAVTPLDALAAFGGFEIAAMTGAVLAAAAERRVIVVDGFISTAAVLVAHRLAPHVTQRCVFSHRSGEAGHALMLRQLGPRADEPARPLLDLGLRLGEGSGAALAWPLLASAAMLLRDMASFASAEVSGKLP